MDRSNRINSDDLEKSRIQELLKYERQLRENGAKYIAGIDEAGRGPLAGPVVAAAVIFPDNLEIWGINDSKLLSAKQREVLFTKIWDQALAIGIGAVDEISIDKINILQATFLAMRTAITKLHLIPHHALVDGRMTVPGLTIPQTAIPKGDSKCFSIAAASIIAKVTRDRLMIAYDRQFPEYGFAQHKGYPTQKHIEAIMKNGRCPIHRASFKIKRME
jgi:ribonuclease HII